MPWGAVAGAVVSSALSDSGKDKGGGAGTTTASKEPWAAAAPWLQSQISTGQDLQQQYQRTPFNPQQLAAYANMGRQTNYMNNVVPDLLGQLNTQGQQQLGFNRGNPNARPQAFNFNGAGNGTGSGGGSGLLSTLTSPSTLDQFTSAANPPPPPPVAPPPPGQFHQQGTAYNAPPSARSTKPGVEGMIETVMSGSRGDGSYGSFTYGMQPKPGTQEYRDMQEYFNWGGDDPYNTYGRRTNTDNGPLGGGS